MYMFSKNILKKLDFKFEIVWGFFLFNDVLNYVLNIYLIYLG